MRVSVTSKGEWKKTSTFLKSITKNDRYKSLESAAQKGVTALSSATPRRSGQTASSWGYDINVTDSGATITWTNAHVVNGVPIAVILQYGHGTGTGGYVAGQDYINPAIKPVFDEISDKVWKAVTST